MTTRQIVSRSRSRLKSLEASADHAIRTAHAQMLATLKPHLDALYADIAAEQQNHEDGKIPLSWLSSHPGVSILKLLITSHVDSFAQQGHAQVLHVESQATALGTRAGREQIQAVKEKR